MLPRYVVSFRSVAYDQREGDWRRVFACVEAADAAEAQVFARAEAQLGLPDLTKYTGWIVVGQRRLLDDECPCCAQGPTPRVFMPEKACDGCGRLPEGAEKEFRRMRRMPGAFP